MALNRKVEDVEDGEGFLQAESAKRAPQVEKRVQKVALVRRDLVGPVENHISRETVPMLVPKGRVGRYQRHGAPGTQTRTLVPQCSSATCSFQSSHGGKRERRR